MKIIYVYFHPLTQKMEKDFYIDRLIKTNEIEYWDVSKLYFNNLHITDKVNKDFIKTPNSYKDIKRRINNNTKLNTPVVYIILMNYSFKTIRIFHLFKKFECKTGSILSNGFPNLNVLRNFNQSQFKLSDYKSINISFYKIFVSKLQSYFASFLKKLLINEHNFIFVSGKNNYLISKKIESRIKINFFDYDEYLRSNTNTEQRIIPEKYCVFLDDFLINHPDFKMKSFKLFNPSKYWNEMNAFFDTVEKKLNYKVVIAAHPKANYSEDLFNGRLVVKNESRRLVKYAELVITHMSTSISYAILYNKPIVFTTMDMIKSYLAYHNIFIHEISKYLSSNYVNINNYTIEEIDIKTVDREKYRNFKYDFLTSLESENQLSEIIINTYLNKDQFEKNNN